MNSPESNYSTKLRQPWSKTNDQSPRTPRPSSKPFTPRDNVNGQISRNSVKHPSSKSAYLAYNVTPIKIHQNLSKRSEDEEASTRDQYQRSKSKEESLSVSLSKANAEVQELQIELKKANQRIEKLQQTVELLECDNKDIKEELERATKDLIEFYYEKTQKEKEKLLEEAKKRLDLKEKDTFRKKLEAYCLEKKLQKPVFSFIGNEHNLFRVTVEVDGRHFNSNFYYADSVQACEEASKCALRELCLCYSH